MESKKRSVLKAISWRLVATISTGVIVYLVTKEAILGLGIICGTEVVVKFIRYFTHERIWAKIGWGYKKS